MPSRRQVFSLFLLSTENAVVVLDTRGKEEDTLINVQAVISSYAVEIAMKSLWALDNPTESIPHTHDLVVILKGLKEETVKSLRTTSTDLPRTGKDA